MNDETPYLGVRSLGTAERARSRTGTGTTPAATPLTEPAPAPDPAPTAPRFSAVDGLRGAGILTVLLHDTGIGVERRYFPWTGAGVDVLLVLAGFLTALPLLRGATATGRTGAAGFLARRAKRLLPALVASLAVTVALCQAFGAPGLARDLTRRPPSGLLGYDGWADWAHGRPLGGLPTIDSPLTPMWLWDLTARSVLLWTLLLAFLGLLARRRLAPVALVAALGAGAAVVAADRGALPALADLVTGTQALALPAGVAAACAVHLAERGGRAMSRAAAALLSVTGIAAAAALAVSAAHRGTGQGDDRYVVALLLATALLTATLCGSRGPLARLLSAGLLTEVGRMSYTLFLLHLPVYWLLWRGQPGIGPVALFLVGGAATWFLSLLVHYLMVERLAARPWWRRRRKRAARFR